MSICGVYLIPMKLGDIIGQPTAMRILGGSMRRARVASAYLFAGEDGIGKRSTAIAFAMALNCLEPVSGTGELAADACGRCDSCRKIVAHTHPDFLIVTPDREEIRRAQIRRDDGARDGEGEPYRSVEEVLQFRANEARTRVVIIDEAHKLNQSAANAFLKTLEEPPTDTTIILISSSPETLPQTIRSRCLRVPFRPLSLQDTATVMGVDEDSEAAALAMGRPGYAMGGDLVANREQMIEQISKMRAEGERPSWATPDDAAQWIEDFSVLLRDLAVMRATGEAALLINRDIPQELHAMASRPQRGVKGIIKTYENLRALRASLVLNLNRSITWNYAGTIIGELDLVKREY